MMRLGEFERRQTHEAFIKIHPYPRRICTNWGRIPDHTEGDYSWHRKIEFVHQLLLETFAEALFEMNETFNANQGELASDEMKRRLREVYDGVRDDFATELDHHSRGHDPKPHDGSSFRQTETTVKSLNWRPEFDRQIEGPDAQDALQVYLNIKVALTIVWADDLTRSNSQIEPWVVSGDAAMKLRKPKALSFPGASDRASSTVASSAEDGRPDTSVAESIGAAEVASQGESYASTVLATSRSLLNGVFSMFIPAGSAGDGRADTVVSTEEGSTSSRSSLEIPPWHG